MFGAGRFIVFTLLHLSQPTTGLNILQITEGFNPSHVFFSYGMAEPLIKNGHNVTLLLVQHFLDLSFIPSPPNITEYRISSSAGPEALRLGAEAYQTMSFSSHTFLSFMDGVYFGFESQAAHCETLLRASGNSIMESLKSTYFDVALTPVVDPCLFFLFDTLGIKSVAWHSAFSSTVNTVAAIAGIPISPSYIPEPFLAVSLDKMGFFERLENLGKEGTSR